MSYKKTTEFICTQFVKIFLLYMDFTLGGYSTICFKGDSCNGEMNINLSESWLLIYWMKTVKVGFHSLNSNVTSEFVYHEGH